MTDEQIRAIVREALAQHLPSSREAAAPMPSQSLPLQSLPAPPWRGHPSFGRFLEQPSGTQEGMCVIEPAVRCNGCGFCQCFGY